ncbi:Gfo/Idh/MocA family protein [Clostridium frigidicarnis]|uniref:Predicted dehydrogenase n=1 Tax=Clostridium frigidicarnis TaxID=84698 RepID=A0A1I0Z073_9CLOT|nr:Gfo/Idh/MocA family oxidoreductase [Clostridium frigidicarnis]SFB18822.1 Predicted dehydrogenase [Clostridium frigidicarnis]
MNKIRFGVIGTNNITQWFLNGSKNCDRFSLTAIYSRSKEKALEFGDKYGVTTVFTDLEEMAKSHLIDAVYIASPNALHCEQTILFLNNNKHVLCEKAFASNAKEVNIMIEVAKNNNVILMEAMKTTVLPNFKAIKNNIHKIGKVRKYFSSYCQYSSRYDKYKEGIILNAFNPKLSNGALMDIGVYTIHPMVNLFGKPNSLKASSVMLDSGIDGEGSIIFKYDELEGVVMYSKISNSYLPSEIQGENGSIIIDNIHNFQNVKIVFRDGREEELSIEQLDDDMYYEIEEFINIIQEKKEESQTNTLNNSKIVAELMEETRKQIGLVFPADLK